MATKYVVSGDQRLRFDRKVTELMRQVHSQESLAFDPEALIDHLQDATEGRFNRTQPSAREVKIFAEWCAKWPEFWNLFGVDVSKIMSHQNFPKAPRPGFPWSIVDPGLMDDAVLTETLFKKIGISYWVSVALLEYSNSSAPGTASAILVRDTIEPDKEYLGKSVDDADGITEKEGKRFILRRHWVILFAFLWLLTKGKQKLDVKGWTRFPKNRLSCGSAADGDWDPGRDEVELDYVDSDSQYELAGPREGNFFPL